MRPLLTLLFAVPIWAATPTFGTLTASAASPNSITASVTITGGVSQQIQASINAFSTHIDSPWFPVTASAIAAQLQPSTLYSIRVVACDATVTAWASCGGNLGTSGTATATTSSRLLYYDPIVLTLGSTVSYNTSQFSNGKYTGFDVNSVACMTNGTCVVAGGDGRGPQDSLFDGVAGTNERNIHVSTVNSTFTTIALLNAMGTGDGSNGFGGGNQLNIPGCWSDSTTTKPSSMFAQGNTLFLAMYRVTVDGHPTSRWIQRSDDGGATWYRPGHTAGQSSSLGDPPCPANVMWAGEDKVGLPRFLQLGIGGAISHPKDGIDAYWYMTTRDVPNTFTYLMRCHKNLDPQVDTNWEGYTGAPGGNASLPANWSITIASMVALEAIDTTLEDLTLSYVPDSNRFVATGEAVVGGVIEATDLKLAMKDSPTITGPYVLRYSEPTPTPYNAAHNYYLNRAWLQIFWPTYTLTSSTPVVVDLKLWHNGTFPANYFPADPVNNWYSPQEVAVTLTTQKSLFPLPGGVVRTR